MGYIRLKTPDLSPVCLLAYALALSWDPSGNGTSGETDYHIGSGSTLKGDAQYEWLEEGQTSNFNRTLTPWLMVIFHPPWYNSYTAGYYGTFMPMRGQTRSTTRPSTRAVHTT
ncbi:hypothetical protein WJX84_010131 [Apatococcus fuscideae]|uniref:Uncharacterized protein n=1 Tax=Apatococcus fuscideae TaxID=2026836 RepID=A0AAW1TGG2_9CHLO